MYAVIQLHWISLNYSPIFFSSRRENVRLHFREVNALFKARMSILIIAIVVLGSQKCHKCYFIFQEFLLPNLPQDL